MIGSNARANETAWVLVISEETPDLCHVSFSESLGQISFVYDHNVVLEVSKAELILKCTLFHFDCTMLDNAAQLVTLAR